MNINLLAGEGESALGLCELDNLIVGQLIYINFKKSIDGRFQRIFVHLSVIWLFVNESAAMASGDPCEAVVSVS